MSSDWENSWIWHPDWIEKPTSSSAGAFVHFRKSIDLNHIPSSPIKIAITADTRYKLYINSRLVHAGPVKGDQQTWFYDILDIQPYLRAGRNDVAVHVLRFHHGCQFAPSFPRTPYAGLYIKHEPCRDDEQQLTFNLQTDDTWETAIDPCRILPASSNFDYFLHTFEQVDQRESCKLSWVPAKPYSFMVSYGLATPWNLHPRMIPFSRLEPTYLQAIHNVRSSQSCQNWKHLFHSNGQHDTGILLPKGTKHHVELGVEYHTTAYVAFRFARPSTSGSTLTVTWSEGYEDEPIKLPFARKKGDRTDATKLLVGPKDHYIFAGNQPDEALLGHSETEKDDEIFAPFHFRTFRYFALDIQVAEDSDLVLKGIDIVKTNYHLQVSAAFPQVETEGEDSAWFHQLWEVSLRTLQNCMHDCYEDCPFFEQLQYAMDTRSSVLFTYFVSRDDHLARQAIIQLYNSFQPAIGLTASRAPSHHLQIISHFSLFWVIMVTDHYEHFGDAAFVTQFLPVIDAVLNTFRRRLDLETGLIRNSQSASDWAFVDWSEAYQPLGIPPAGEATGFMTYTNQLYAYTLQRLSLLQSCMNRQSRSDEYTNRANSIVQAIRTYCFDGVYFTDGLAKLAQPNHYSEHSQIWAVLCGAITGKEAVDLLNRSLTTSPVASNGFQRRELTKVSIAMAFYSLRALSTVDGETYEAYFQDFWEPWRKQLALHMTTWVEDYITQRSDCHAWGSLPLYEFTAEVAGLKPLMSGGERVLVFKPRVRLFTTFDAKVPVGGSVEKPIIAHIRWQRNGEAVVDLSLSWAGHTGGEQESNLLAICVVLPDGRQETIKMFERKQWEVRVSK